MYNFKWTPLKHRAAYLLATEPKKNYEIANMLGVTVQTLWNWRQYTEFNSEIKKISDAEIKAWLKNRAEVQFQEIQARRVKI